jgi:hypothetical protein
VERDFGDTYLGDVAARVRIRTLFWLVRIFEVCYQSPCVWVVMSSIVIRILCPSWLRYGSFESRALSISLFEDNNACYYSQ